MLIRPPDEPGAENQEARQRYEIMQCFTVSQPKLIKEEGEGKTEDCFFGEENSACLHRIAFLSGGGRERICKLSFIVLLQDISCKGMAPLQGLSFSLQHFLPSGLMMPAV